MASVRTIGENPGPALPTWACQLTPADADALNSGKGPGLFGSYSQRSDGAGMVGIHSLMVAHPESASADTASAANDNAFAAGACLLGNDMQKRTVIACRPARVVPGRRVVRT